MPRLDAPGYTAAFAAAVSLVCAALVSVSAVALRDRQEANAQLYRQKNVLLAAGLVEPPEALPDARVRALFDERIQVRAIDLESGELVPEDRFDARGFDPRKARDDPQLSRAAPPNEARVARVPKRSVVFLVKGEGGRTEQVVLPIEGMGMWGMLYGLLAVERDGNTVRGLTFYEQKETPGLGGEISNPRWQALWRGRKVYDASWEPKLSVVKGTVGPPTEDPHRVDALSGATITSNGVSRVVAFWLSRHGYAPFLQRFRSENRS